MDPQAESNTANPIANIELHGSRTFEDEDTFPMSQSNLFDQPEDFETVIRPLRQPHTVNAMPPTPDRYLNVQSSPVSNSHLMSGSGFHHSCYNPFLSTGFRGSDVLHTVSSACRMPQTPETRPVSQVRTTPTHKHPIINDVSDIPEEDLEKWEEELRLRRIRLEQKGAATAASVSSTALRLNPNTQDCNVPNQTPASSCGVGLENQMNRLILGLSLPKIEIDSFDGSPLDFHNFIRSFDCNVAQRLVDDGQRLSYLMYYCKGNARKAIQHCSLIPTGGYQEALRILRMRFGRPHEIIQAVTKSVFDGPKISTGDTVGLQDLVTQMHSCQLTVSQLGRVNDLDCSTNLVRIIARLPKSIQERWADVADSIINRGDEPKFEDLILFLEKRISVASNIYGQLAAKSVTQDRNYEPMYLKRQTRSTVSTLSTYPLNENKCILCEVNHELIRCPRFLSQCIDERIDVLKRHKRCFVCLRANHIAKDCRSRTRCNVPNCSGRHHYLLHRYPSVESTSMGVRSEPSNCSNVLLGCIPVRLIGPNKTIETYGFLDNGSDTTLITKTVARQLGLHLNPCTLNVSTLSGASTLPSNTATIGIQSLENGNETMAVCSYTVDELPKLRILNASDIDSQRWPHLAGIKLPTIPNKDVGILIGCDVPEAHVVVQQRIGHGRQPYAVKTNLGWSIRGPWDSITVKEILINYIGAKPDLFPQTIDKSQHSDQAEHVLSITDQLSVKTIETTSVCCDDRDTGGLTWQPQHRKHDSIDSSCTDFVDKLSANSEMSYECVRAVTEHLREDCVSKVECSEVYSQLRVSNHLGKNTTKHIKECNVLNHARTILEKPLSACLFSANTLSNNLLHVLMRSWDFKAVVFADSKEPLSQLNIPENLAMCFWNQWVKQYIQIHLTRYKRAEGKQNIIFGGHVSVVRSPISRNKWKRTVVVKVLMGTDSLVRKTKVRTPEWLVLKDIRSLCLLEGDERPASSVDSNFVAHNLSTINN